MDLHKAFSTALSLVPETERPLNHYFTLHRGNLIFSSQTGKSWFVIANFIPGDVSARLSSTDIATISALGSGVQCKRIDPYTVNFFTPRHGLRVGCVEPTSIPEVTVPDTGIFEDANPVYELGRRGFTLTRDGTRVGTTAIDGLGYFVIAEANMIAAVVAHAELPDMDMTYMSRMVSSAISRKSKIAVRDRTLFIHLDFDSSSIYAGSMFNKFPLSEAAIRQTQDVHTGEMHKDSETIVVEFAAQDVLEAARIIGSMQYSGYVEYTIADGEMHIKATSTLRSEYAGSLACTADGKISFYSFLLTRPMIMFMATASGKLEDARIRLLINTTERRLVFRPVECGEARDVFILLPLSFNIKRS